MGPTTIDTTLIVVAPAGSDTSDGCAATDADFSAGLQQAQLMRSRVNGGIECHVVVPRTRTGVVSAGVDASRAVCDALKGLQPQCVAFVGEVASAEGRDENTVLSAGNGEQWTPAGIILALQRAGITKLELLLLHGSHTIDVAEDVLTKVR